MQQLILASASPRRREILTRLGYQFILCPSGAEEKNVSGHVCDMVKTLAERKAAYVAPAFQSGIIIGCDTLVSLDDKPLGKPADPDNAFRMIRSLAGRSHEVYSGICLFDAETKAAKVDYMVSKVFFRELSDAEIKEYVASGEPMDKAGGYAIQGGAAKFITGYEGSYDNIVGFPTERFLELIGRG